MGIFSPSPPSAPYVPPLPAAPPPPAAPVDQAAETAAQQTQARLAAAGGFGGTIATGGQGVTTPAPTTMKTLLGQ
jgi:hypothetical protein